MRESPDLFDELVTASGLSPVFAQRSLERVLGRLGLSRAALTSAHIEAMLPALQQTLRLYLPAPEAELRLADLRALAR